MNTLIVNSGSTSVKYSYYRGDTLEFQETFSRKNQSFSDVEKKLLLDLEFDYASFRIVHSFDVVDPGFVDDAILEKIKDAISLAPLHNSKAVEIIEFLMANKDTQIFAVFDTEFHKSMPNRAKILPINAELAKKYGIRRFGFHGLAFESALDKLKDGLGYLPERIIAIHAGGGVSVCAILDGKSQDTTMSFTPTDGIMMLTRSGSVDPDIARFLIEKENLIEPDLYELFNEKSGFYGLTSSKDTKFIIEQAKQAKEPYKSAYDLFLYQLKKQVFAYLGVLGSVDIVLLSGGLAYNNEYFADDLFSEIKHLPIRKEQIFKAQVNENEVILRKLKEALLVV